MTARTHINGPVWPLAACASAVLAICAFLAADEPATESPAKPATSEAATQPATAAANSGRVSNIWVETDLRQVLQDISSQTDTAILCDQSVQGTISLSVKDLSVAACLERICAPGGYTFVKVKDYYVVGRADPASPIFSMVSAPERVGLSYATCEQVRSMLHPSLAPYVTFDKGTNAVLVTAPESLRRCILEALKLIDQPKQQVVVEAIVFELTEEGSKQLGLDWQYKKTNLNISSDNLVGTVTYNAASDLATYVEVTLRAILQSKNAQVLANPRILVMNGVEAEIFVGQEKYYSLLSGQASNPYYTLQSIKAGVTLRVMPQIGQNGQITLAFEPEVSDVVTDDNRDSVDAHGNTTAPLPVVTRRHAKTVVGIQDGQTIVMGGLLREQHRSLVEKVPLLGDAPLIGPAFRNVRKQREQQEVVILITTYLVNERSAEADDVSMRLEQRYVSPLDAISLQTGGPDSCASRK